MTTSSFTSKQIERHIEDYGRQTSISEETAASYPFKFGFLASMMASLLNGERDIDRLRQEIAGAQQ